MSITSESNYVVIGTSAYLNKIRKNALIWRPWKAEQTIVNLEISSDSGECIN